MTYQVIRVGWKAFSQINTIEEVYIGEGVTTICTAAFDCCRGLKVVHLPDSLVEIERIAFQKCPLERLYIGSSLTTVLGDNFTEKDLQEIADALGLKLEISFIDPETGEKI